MQLKGDFNKFVGMIIKDPQRLTDDTDPNGEKIYAYARKNGLHVQFHKAGEPRGPMGLCVVSLNVMLTKDGVPEDQKGWGWRVSSLNVR
jgi:predicted TIM-barrel fold metal-dependent hydrolase